MCGLTIRVHGVKLYTAQTRIPMYTAQPQRQNEKHTDTQCTTPQPPTKTHPTVIENRKYVLSNCALRFTSSSASISEPRERTWKTARSRGGCSLPRIRGPVYWGLGVGGYRVVGKWVDGE